MPLVTIILPTFNAASSISKALESILSQSFEDFEVIIMDGLSTDNTLEIAQNYNDARIKLFSSKDEGIYDAMNKGLKLAKGEWIYFIGSDDYLFDNNIFKRVFESSNNCSVLYGNVVGPCFIGQYDGIFDLQKLLKMNICHQALFVKKNVFTKLGYFDVQYKSFADWDFNYRLFIHPKIKKQYVDIVFAYYSDNGFSAKNQDALFWGKRFNIIVNYGFKYYLLHLRIPSSSIKKVLLESLHKVIRQDIVKKYPEIAFYNPYSNTLKYILKKRLQFWK